MDSTKTVIQEIKDIFHDIIGTSSFDQHLLEKIHIYVAAVKKALTVSERLRTFFTKQEGVWDEAYAVAQRKDGWDDHDLGDFYYDALHTLFSPQFYDLEKANYNEAEKADKDSKYKRIESQNEWMKEMLNRIHPTIIAELEKTDPGRGIFYNSQTGVGWVGKRRFRFSAKHKAKVFSELYKKINEPVAQDDILRLAEYDPKKYTSEGYFMTKLARELRDGTKLSPDELVLNKALTLLGYKLESPPK